MPLAVAALIASCSLLAAPAVGPQPAIVSAAAVSARATTMVLDDEAVYTKLAETVTPALVSVKFVMDFDGGFGASESEESEVHGVMVREDGIVMVSSAMMFGYEGMGFEVRPRDIKIKVGDDTEGVAAEVIIRDRERDLAWLKITEPGETKFAAVSFDGGAPVGLGAGVLQVMKLDSYFDKAAYIIEGKVASVVRKPRDLFVASGEVSIGLPVFDRSGTVVGFGVLQLPEQAEMAAMQNSLSAQLVFAHTVLPAADVAGATAAALASLEDEE